MEIVNINTFIQDIEENIDAIEAGTLAPDTCLRELPARDSLAVLSMLAPWWMQSLVSRLQAPRLMIVALLQKCLRLFIPSKGSLKRYGFAL